MWAAYGPAGVDLVIGVRGWRRGWSKGLKKVGVEALFVASPEEAGVPGCEFAGGGRSFVEGFAWSEAGEGLSCVLSGRAQ